MNKISFISFCVEYYAQHINQPSDEVYALLKREQVLNFLENDYDDLHGMGMEYMMQMMKPNFTDSLHCISLACSVRNRSSCRMMKEILIYENISRSHLSLPPRGRSV